MEKLPPSVIATGTAIVTAALTWAALTIRRAVRNRGKTDLDIAMEHLAQAQQAEADAARAEELAAQTPGAEDDAAAAKRREAAERRLQAAQAAIDHARRWKAVTDAVGEDTEKPAG